MDSFAVISKWKHFQLSYKVKKIPSCKSQQRLAAVESGKLLIKPYNNTVFFMTSNIVRRTNIYTVVNEVDD